MKKMIGDSIGHSPDTKTCVPSDALVDTTLVGVEVELENIRGLDVDGGTVPYGKRWVAVYDGSLRDHGAEFVLREPLSGKDLVDSLIALERKLKYDGIEPRISDRTSVHIHLDIRSLSIEELRNLILLYTIFERPLFNYAGKNRKHNIFCASFADTQGLLPIIHKSIMTKDEMHRHFFGGFQKYTSCNLLAIMQHGSIEFRQHAGEFRAVKLLRWINILMSMHKYAQMKRIIPKNLGSEISELGMERFTRMVFGKFYDNLVYPDMERDVLEGIRLSQDLIHMLDIEKHNQVEAAELDKRPFTAYLKKLGRDIPEEGHIDMGGIDYTGIDMDWMKVVLNNRGAE